MTPERKRALLMIGATLIIGILIGVLGMGLWSKQSRRGGKSSATWRQEGKEVFMQRIIKEANADSLQAKQMKPLMMETMARIDSLQNETDKNVHAVLGSFEEKLKPILREDQLKKLQEFHRKGRKR
ncbi:MAG: hypothetical protein ABL895_01915 [Cyclobacteriaceae bacterium]